MNHEDMRNPDGSCPNKIGSYTGRWKEMDLSPEEIQNAEIRQTALPLPEDAAMAHEAFEHMIKHPGYTTLVVGVACDGLPNDNNELCTSLVIAGPNGSFSAMSITAAIEILACTVTENMVSKGQSPLSVVDSLTEAVHRGVKRHLQERMGPFSTSGLLDKLREMADKLSIRDLPKKDQPFKDLEA